MLLAIYNGHIAMEDEVLQLGGNIELSGFSELDGGVMIVLKKIIGNYAKRMSEKASDFEKLSMNMKLVHAKEKSEKYNAKTKRYEKNIVDKFLLLREEREGLGDDPHNSEEKVGAG